jgi:alpha-1,3-rhamnosyltransferase
MNKPLVSVIISSYNHQDYIEKTISSIVNQSYGFENIQLIVIDDCSTDNTAEKLKNLASINNFEFTINSKNKGICFNFNTLISKSIGKYVAICSSDDFWELNKIEKQVKLLESLNEEYAICHTDAIIIDENENQLFVHNQGKYYTENVMPIVLMSTGIIAPSVIIRKKVFNLIGEFDINMPFEDRDLWIRLGIHYKFAYIPESLVYRRVHKTNLGKNPNKMPGYKTYTMLFEKHYEYYKKYKLTEEFNFFLFNHMSTFSFKLSVKHMLKSGKALLKIRTFYALIKLFTPKFIFDKGLENKIKLIFNKW